MRDAMMRHCSSSLLAMRTTLSIAPDVLSAARHLAAVQSRSIGDVISDLARKGLETSIKTTQKSGFPVFEVPSDARPVTLEDIKREDDEW
jgi:hypothetical protein